MCSLNPLKKDLETIACHCGSNNEACAGVTDAIMPIGDIDIVAGEEEVIRVGPVQVAVFTDSVSSEDDVLNVEIGIESSDSLLVFTSSSSRRVRRSLVATEGAEKARSASCFAIVKNEEGTVVGQVVGDCVSFDPSAPLANEVELCMHAKTSIPVDYEVFVVAGVASMDSTSKAVTALDQVVTVKEGKYCAMVTAAGVYCPTRNIDAWFGAVQSDVDTSCGAFDVILSEVVDDLSDAGVVVVEDLPEKEEQKNPTETDTHFGDDGLNSPAAPLRTLSVVVVVILGFVSVVLA